MADRGHRIAGDRGERRAKRPLQHGEPDAIELARRRRQLDRREHRAGRDRRRDHRRHPAAEPELLARRREQEREDHHPRDVGELAGDEPRIRRLEHVIVHHEQCDREQRDRRGERAGCDHGFAVAVMTRDVPAGISVGVPCANACTQPLISIAGRSAVASRCTISSKSSLHGSVSHASHASIGT